MVEELGSTDTKEDEKRFVTWRSIKLIGTDNGNYGGYVREVLISMVRESFNFVMYPRFLAQKL